MELSQLPITQLIDITQTGVMVWIAAAISKHSTHIQHILATLERHESNIKENSNEK